jgi:hypothetical protein
MLIQINIPEKINRQLKIFKAKEGYSNMEQAIIDILASRFDVDEYYYDTKKKEVK